MFEPFFSGEAAPHEPKQTTTESVVENHDRISETLPMVLAQQEVAEEMGYVGDEGVTEWVKMFSEIFAQIMKERPELESLYLTDKRTEFISQVISELKKRSH